jgi:hypothetical protein
VLDTIHVDTIDAVASAKITGIRIRPAAAAA